MAYVIVIDELHKHQTRELIEAFEASKSGRK